MRSIASGTSIRTRAKGSVQLGNGHRVDASFFGDPAKGDMGPQRLSSLVRTDTSAFSSLEVRRSQPDAEVRRRHPSELARRGDGVAREEQPGRSFRRSTRSRFSDTTVVPNIVSGGIGFYEAGNEGINLQYQAKSTHIFGGHQIRYGVLYEDIEYNNINQYTGPTFTLSDGQQTATGASVRVLSDPERRADLSRDAGEPEHGPLDDAAVHQLLRAGHVADRQPAHDSTRASATSSRSWSERSTDFKWRRQLGATHRRHLRRARERPLEAVCELGPLLRQGAERPRGPCAVGRCGRDARGLLRCRADAADSRGRAAPGPDLETRHLQLRRAVARRTSIRTRSPPTWTRRWSGSSSSRSRT